MRLDYGTQLSPCPISLSIGTIRKPTLKDIATISFEKFMLFEVFTKLSPSAYYEKISSSNSYWDSLSEDEKDEATMYKVIMNDERVRNIYIDVLNFFFVEKVIYKEGFFVILQENADENKLIPEMVRGVIQESTFSQVLNIIQQICGIESAEDESIENLKFKNAKAKRLYLRMLKAQKEQKKQAKNDINLSIPNIISAVASKHPSLNLTSIWDLTIFQLLDRFSRLQANTVYEIDSTRVSVWGDEKKTFDPALWYKNIYDKK